MKISKITLSLASLLLFVVVWTGCGDASKEDATEKVNLDVAVDEGKGMLNKMNKAKNVLFMIPSPLETLSLLKKAGAEYHGDILNDPNNASRYETARKQALNLGIYGADLSYASLFDQTQEATFFVKSAKSLAEGLGIMKAFDEKMFARIEENINEQDSMMHIIADSYWTANAYLKENEKENTSALIIIGGWLEGLHIATHIAAEIDNNAGVVKRIAEQKYSIDNLMGLISAYEQDSDIDYVMNDLKSIKALYDNLEVVIEAGETSTDNNGITVIGGMREVKISDEQLAEISAKVEEIRTKYIE